MFDKDSNIVAAYDIRSNANQENKQSVSVELTSELLQHVETGLKKQIEHQNEIIDELIEKDQRRQEAFMNQGVELYEKNKETIALKKRIKELEELANNPEPLFEHFSDTRHFENNKKENPTRKWVNGVWDLAYDFTLITDEKGRPIVNNNAYIVAMKMALSDASTATYHYTSSNREYAHEWNENVANRHTDPKRREKLTISAQTLADNKHKVKGVDTWYTLSMEGTAESNFYKDAYRFKSDIMKYTG